MKTLTDMRYYVCKLQNDPMKPETQYFPGNILHLDDKVQGKDTKVKFILFTNIRLDFSPDKRSNCKEGEYGISAAVGGTERGESCKTTYNPKLIDNGVDPRKVVEDRNNSLREAYINSVVFSESINPFIEKSTNAGCVPPKDGPTPMPAGFSIQRSVSFGKRKYRHRRTHISHHSKKKSSNVKHKKIKYMNKKIKEHIHFLKHMFSGSGGTKTKRKH
jgi:hypothetical protein